MFGHTAQRFVLSVAISAWIFGCPAPESAEDPEDQLSAKGTFALFVERTALRPGFTDLTLVADRLDLYYVGGGAPPAVAADGTTRCNDKKRVTVSSGPISIQVPLTSTGPVFVETFDAPTGVVAEIRLVLSSLVGTVDSLPVVVRAEVACSENASSLQVVRLVPKSSLPFEVVRDATIRVAADLDALGQLTPCEAGAASNGGIHRHLGHQRDDDDDDDDGRDDGDDDDDNEDGHDDNEDGHDDNEDGYDDNDSGHDDDDVQGDDRPQCEVHGGESVSFLLASTLGWTVGSVAGDYDHQDLWSTASNRDEWTAWLGSQSRSPVQTNYDSIGHLHGLAGKIPIVGPIDTAVSAFLNGTFRQQLGLRNDDQLRLIASHNTSATTLTNGAYVQQARLELRFAVEHAGYLEVGRDLLVLVDPTEEAIVGVFNGHIPSIGRYVPFTFPITLPVALGVVGIAEGGPVTAQNSLLGWFAAGWMDSRRPGPKELVWLLKVVTPEGNLRDYIVSATSGAVLFQGPDRYYFAHQRHQGYAPGGATYFSTLPGVPGCLAIGPGCTDPAFTDSLASRQLMPGIVAEVENLTTPGYLGTSGVWAVPNSWTLNPRMTPYQNNHLDPTVDTFSVVLAANSFTTSYCAPRAPPCSTRNVHVYGVGDVDASLYGHEYSHGLFSMTKTLRTQTGPDGQLAEGVMDIAGVSFENAFKVRRNPCISGPMCLFERTDFILEAPSLGLVISMYPPVLSCQVPRAWVGGSFKSSVDELALEALVNCENALCGLPTRPGAVLAEQDVALEVMFAAFIRVFDAAPMLQPMPADVLASSIALSGSSRPIQLLSQALQASAGAVPCP